MSIYFDKMASMISKSFGTPALEIYAFDGDIVTGENATLLK